jgi:hypothetical protein
VLDYGLDDRGFDSRQGLGIFLSTMISRPALRPTQPPIQWVPWALSLGVKRLVREANHSPPSSAEVKECVELYLHSPIASIAICSVKKAQEQLYFYTRNLSTSLMVGEQFSHPQKMTGKIMVLYGIMF